MQIFAIGKAGTRNVPWTILELLGCVEEVERRMIALPIMSFALDQWRRSGGWLAGGSEARAAENELRRVQCPTRPIARACIR